MAEWVSNRLQTQFAGQSAIDPFLESYAFRTPRLMLRILDTYRRAFFSIPQENQAYGSSEFRLLSSSFPFWLCYLACIHCTLPPDEAYRMSRKHYIEEQLSRAELEINNSNEIDSKNDSQDNYRIEQRSEEEIFFADKRHSIISALVQSQVQAITQEELDYLYATVREKCGTFYRR